MAINSLHPDYQAALPDWVIMSDVCAGQSYIKSKRQVYLPATSGQVFDGFGTQDPNAIGNLAYNSYLKRARFPGFTKEAIKVAIGMLHNQKAEITVPKKLEGILKNATPNGGDIYSLLMKINEGQLKYGRVGLLLDTPSEAEAGLDTPYIAVYEARSIINWATETKLSTESRTLSEELQLIVLDESSNKFSETDYTWNLKHQYRVLTIQDNKYNCAVYDNDALDIDPSKNKLITYRGQPLDRIPFVICNPSDLDVEIDSPPLLDLANLCLSVYMSDADYRQNLHMQGQDTLVIIGATLGGDDTETVRTGAGSVLNVAMGGDAKYIGLESNGLSEQREAIENDKARAGSMGAQSTDTVSRQRESGTSLQTRMSVRTADLTQIALTGAEALKKILRMAAIWVGAEPDEVVVRPNLDFGDTQISPQNFVELQSAKNLGLPISGESIHAILSKKGYTDLTYEEELGKLKDEEGGVLDKNQTGDMNPQQSVKSDMVQK